MRLFGWVFVSVFVFSPVFVDAQGYKAQSLADLLLCYESASSPEARYGCFGSTVTSCVASSSEPGGPDISACADAETAAWEGIRSDEYERVVQSILALAETSKSCQPDAETCLQNLSKAEKNARVVTKLKCAEASSEPNAAGEPAMALSLCNLREAARSTIRLRIVRDRFE